MKMNLKNAVKAVEKNGLLLVFPDNNKTEPRSLWSEFFPRSKMKWDWDNDGDTRVHDLWRLMKELSSCREVVYSKWFRGRATFFSREAFTALLAAEPESHRLSSAAKSILQELEMDSPLSTKQIKSLTDLQGRFNEPIYQKAMQELFQKFLIVAFGEVDDGAFPSLAIGSTKILFEDLVIASKTDSHSPEDLERFLPQGSLWRKFYNRSRPKM